MANTVNVRRESSDPDKSGQLIAISPPYILGPYFITYQTPGITVEDASATQAGVLLDDVTIPVDSLVRAYIEVQADFEGWDAVSVDAVLNNVAGTAGSQLGGPASGTNWGTGLGDAISVDLVVAPGNGAIARTRVATKPAAYIDINTGGGGSGPLTAGRATMWFEVWEQSA